MESGNYRVNGLKIYVDQLKHGHIEKIREKLNPEFLEISEKDLAFEDPIFIEGEAYLAEGNLVLHVEVSTLARISCAICNNPVKVAIELPRFYHTEPLSQIKGGVFLMKEALREAILLETPPFAECNQGKCPQRKELEKYFKTTTTSLEDEEPHYRPFEGLKLE